MAERTRLFFAERKEWSRRKHEILVGYAPQFGRILGRDGGTVFLVDGFAGSGTYGEGTRAQPGSPVLAGQLASELAEKGAYDLRCINVEADREEFRALETATAPYSRFVENLQGRFADHVDAILDHVGPRPALFFLDPFGIGGLDWATLKKIGERPQHLKTELLINFNSPMFDRHAGWRDSLGQPARDAFMDLLDRTVGSDEWLDVVERHADTRANLRRELIMEFYLGRIHRTFGFNAASYPVRTVDTEQLKYHILFASRHQLAMRIMGSILYGVEQRYLHERAAWMLEHQPLQLKLELFPREPTIEELEEQSVQELRENVLAIGRQRRRIGFGALQDELMSKWFGRLVEKHYRRVCSDLIAEGAIDRDRAKGITDSTILVFQ